MIFVTSEYNRSIPGGLKNAIDSPQMNSVEAYIQFTPGLFADDGEITDPSVEGFLRKYMEELQAFIGRVFTALPRG